MDYYQALVRVIDTAITNENFDSLNTIFDDLLLDLGIDRFMNNLDIFKKYTHFVYGCYQDRGCDSCKHKFFYIIDRFIKDKAFYYILDFSLGEKYFEIVTQRFKNFTPMVYGEYLGYIISCDIEADIETLNNKLITSEDSQRIEKITRRKYELESEKEQRVDELVRKVFSE